MINNNISSVPNFISQAKLLIPIMHNRLSGSSNQKIVLSKSLSIEKPLIIPIEEADANCISLEDFLSMVYARINAEFAYHNEVIQLKDNLCEEFNKLCDKIADENFIKFVRDQRQRIINAIIDGTKIEKKMIAEQFYNDMMNGWDEKVLNLKQFTEIANTILWKPLLTPLPIESLDRLRKLIEELGKDKSTDKIEMMTTQLVNHIEQHMKVMEIKDSDFEDSVKLKATLEEIIKTRKICRIEIVDTNKSENILIELASNCIESVTLIISTYEFIEKELKFHYNELKLIKSIDGTNIEVFCNKIQKTLKLLDFRMNDGTIYDQMGKIFSKLIDLENLKLDISFNNIGEEGKKALSTALKELKTLSTLNLNLDNIKIGNDGAKELSDALKELKSISTLNLNFEKNNLENEGAEAISNALKELKSISTLNLNFKNNNIGIEGAKALSLGLKELKNISVLALNFGMNYKIGAVGVIALLTALNELTNISSLALELKLLSIEDEGVKSISTMLSKLINISNLTLNLEFNKFGEEGAKAISSGLKELKNILTLDLNIKDNNIEEEGANAMSIALKELKKISNLSLDLSNTNIGEKGIKNILAALKELSTISILSLIFQKNNIQNETAKIISAGLKELKNISIMTLNFQENCIEDEGAKALSVALKELKYVSALNLDLEKNNIGDEGAKTLSTALKELKNVSTMNLSLKDTKIEDKGAKAIINALEELNNIKTLSLNVQSNNIGEEGTSAIEEFYLYHQKYDIQYQI